MLLGDKLNHLHRNAGRGLRTHVNHWTGMWCLRLTLYSAGGCALSHMAMLRGQRREMCGTANANDIPLTTFKLRGPDPIWPKPDAQQHGNRPALPTHHNDNINNQNGKQTPRWACGAVLGTCPRMQMMLLFRLPELLHKTGITPQIEPHAFRRQH